MDARNAFVAICCLSAFACAYCIVWLAAGRLDQQNRAQQLAQRAGAPHALERMLQAGIPGLAAACVRAMRVPAVSAFANKIAGALGQKGYEATPEGALSVVGGGCCAIALACAAAGRLDVGAVLGIGAFVAVSAAAGQVLDARSVAMHDALPDALQSMSSCFGAGFTLLQTFEHLAEEVRGPLGGVFSQAASLMQTGSTPEQALAGIRKSSRMNELAFVSVALSVQHQTGGSMQRVLDATAESLKAELELRRSLRVQTAQARLSARVVSGVTVGLVACMTLLSREFLAPFFASAGGMAMLGSAVAMQVAGIVAVRRLLNVQVDQ